MTPSENNHSRLLEVLNSLVDGLLTDDQHHELQDLIKRDPVARRICVDYLQLSAGLSSYAESAISAFDPTDEDLSVEFGSVQAPAGDTAPARCELPNRFSGFWPSAPMGTWWMSAAAAAAILSTCALASRQWWSESSPPLAEAAWTDGFGVQWSTSDLRQVGSALNAKQYNLLQGVAEVTFKSGAVVVVEAPAQFSITSPDSIAVDHGQLVAKVPDAAHRFTIRSTATEFFEPTGELGIRVLPGGLAEVHVFDGEASIRPTLPRITSAVATALVTGDSRRIDASGVMQEVRSEEVQASSFVRRVGAVVQIDAQLTLPEIAEDFNDGDASWLTGYPYAAGNALQLVEEGGQLVGRIDAGVNDPFFHTAVAGKVIHATEFPFVRFRLAMQDADAYRSNQLFYRQQGEPDSEARSLEFFSGRKQVEEFHARLPLTSLPVEILRLDPVQTAPKSALSFAYDYIFFDRYETLGLAEFDSTGDPQDWQGVNLVESHIDDGCFMGQLYGSDAALRTADVLVDADHFDHLELRLKVQGQKGPLAVYWGKWGDNFSEDKKAIIQPAKDGEFHRYLIDLRRASGWKGSIRLLRINFGDAAGTRFELDYVRALHLRDEQEPQRVHDDQSNLDQAI